MNTEPTSLRLDVDAKKAAYAVFKKVGLKPAQAMNLFLPQVALNQGCTGSNARRVFDGTSGDVRNRIGRWTSSRSSMSCWWKGRLYLHKITTTI